MIWLQKKKKSTNDIKFYLLYYIIIKIYHMVNKTPFT